MLYFELPHTAHNNRWVSLVPFVDLSEPRFLIYDGVVAYIFLTSLLNWCANVCKILALGFLVRRL